METPSFFLLKSPLYICLMLKSTSSLARTGFPGSCSAFRARCRSLTCPVDGRRNHRGCDAFWRPMGLRCSTIYIYIYIYLYIYIKAKDNDLRILGRNRQYCEGSARSTKNMWRWSPAVSSTICTCGDDLATWPPQLSIWQWTFWQVKC